MNYPDMKKFSFTELFNDSHGKTDGHMFCGILMIIVSCITFPYCIYNKLEVYANLTIAFTTLAAGLLGIQRFTSDKNLSLGAPIDTPQPEPEKPTDNAAN